MTLMGQPMARRIHCAVRTTCESMAILPRATRLRAALEDAVAGTDEQPVVVLPGEFTAHDLRPRIRGRDGAAMPAGHIENLDAQLRRHVVATLLVCGRSVAQRLSFRIVWRDQHRHGGLRAFERPVPLDLPHPYMLSAMLGYRERGLVSRKG